MEIHLLVKCDQVHFMNLLISINQLHIVINLLHKFKFDTVQKNALRQITRERIETHYEELFGAVLGDDFNHQIIIED